MLAVVVAVLLVRRSRRSQRTKTESPLEWEEELAGPSHSNSNASLLSGPTSTESLFRSRADTDSSSVGAVGEHRYSLLRQGSSLRPLVVPISEEPGLDGSALDDSLSAACMSMLGPLEAGAALEGSVADNAEDGDHSAAYVEAEPDSEPLADSAEDSEHNVPDAEPLADPASEGTSTRQGAPGSADGLEGLVVAGPGALAPRRASTASQLSSASQASRLSRASKASPAAPAADEGRESPVSAVREAVECLL